MKKYVVIAGVNGAGKTTFFSAENSFNDIEKINLDEVVREIGNWNNPDDVVKAGKLVITRIKEYFEKGVSFSQETTLCGNSILNNLKKAKELGYSIEMYYVGLDSADIAKERVRYRVHRGGHGISDEDIERRYEESLSNMKAVLPMCNKAFVYDNSESFRRIAIFRNGVCERLSGDVPKWYEKAMKDN
ncbi:MAG: ATPase [Lachnospiraceae bacterium]|nr:ATPase [Lachnospiraceae bacterium]